MTQLLRLFRIIPGPVVGFALLIGGYGNWLNAAEPDGPPNAETVAERREARVHARDALAFEAERKKLEKELQERTQKLEEMKRLLAEREAKYADLARIRELEARHCALPQLEDAQAKVYHLKHVRPRDAEQTIGSLIGTKTLRIAVDERSNALIVYGKADSLAALDTLLTSIDKPPATDRDAPKQSGAAVPRSLLVRLFWLADGLHEDEGQDPGPFLPSSVLDATRKLGLTNPRLVTQTVNALAVGPDDSMGFGTQVPAVLANQPAHFASAGTIRFAQDSHARIELEVHVSGVAASELSGSMAMPLGHYMVLGTANSVIGGAQAAERRGGFGGMMPDRRRAGPFSRGFGPEGMEEQAIDPTADQQPGENKLSTSRFAFIVQVVGGESFPPQTATRGDDGPPPPNEPESARNDPFNF